MLSTSVLCVHVTAVVVIVMWAPGFTKGEGFCRSSTGVGRETCSSATSMFCHTGQRPQIVDAHFVNATDHNVCGTNCEAKPNADGAFQCLADLKKTELQCVQRLGYTELGLVYNTCVQTTTTRCQFGDLSGTQLLSVRSTVKVDYRCIPEKSTIDPCITFEKQRSNASLWLPYNTTSCHSVCEITPVNTQRSIHFKYQFLQGFNKTQTGSNEPTVSENNITYEIKFTQNAGKRSQWKQFHSSYYDNYTLLQYVDKLHIRFIIPRGDVVRHLWISFNDTEVNISCTGNSVSTPTAGITSSTSSGSANTASSTPGPITTMPSDQTTSTTQSVKGEDTDVNISSNSTSPPTAGITSSTSSASANAAASTPDSMTSLPGDQATSTTESENREGEKTPTLIITIVAVVVGVVVATGVIVATIFIIRKRRGRQMIQRNAVTKGDNTSRHHDNRANASLPWNDQGAYTECFIPGDSNPDPAFPRDPEAEPIMTTRRGCDVGDEYVTLQHDARVGMAGRSDESENYDHMPPVGVRPRSEVYNVLQRDQKRQEVVDNVYNTTSLTP